MGAGTLLQPQVLFLSPKYRSISSSQGRGQLTEQHALKNLLHHPQGCGCPTPTNPTSTPRSIPSSFLARPL